MAMRFAILVLSIGVLNEPGKKIEKKIVGGIWYGK